MSADIVFESGDGGNGNASDKFIIHGTGWTLSETIAANSITVKNTSGTTVSATTHAARTVDSNGEFSTLVVTITTAITTAGEYNLVVTGSTSGAQTFSSYWTVTEGCGLNDIYRLGNIQKNEVGKDVLLGNIADALDEYKGKVYGYISSADLPHTLGAYPKLAVKIIALLATANTLEGKGGMEYLEKAKTIRKEAEGIIRDLKERRLYLYKTDGTVCTFILPTSLNTPEHTGTFDVTEYHEEELFD